MTLLEINKEYEILEQKKANVKSKGRKDFYTKKQHELTLKYREVNKWLYTPQLIKDFQTN